MYSDVGDGSDTGGIVYMGVLAILATSFKYIVMTGCRDT